MACGINADISVEICGSVGYYCAGMNQRGSVYVDGNASTGLAENIMSGTVRITGSATMSAGATGHGGLVVIEGNAGARCGISMKGVDIVVGGDVGHMSAFMAQTGNLVVLGDAGADAIEVVVGQGAKPGGGEMLLGQKITERVGEMHTLPVGIDQRSACRHPDWTGPDDLQIKIGELREIVDWQVPIYVKVGAARPFYDTALAVKAGADAVVVNGMQGGTAATQEVFIEHVGIPTIAAIPEAVRALRDLGVHRGSVKLIAAGASGPAPTWPRRWLWVPTRPRSARPLSSPPATTTPATTTSTGAWARPPASGKTSRTGPIRPASPPRTRSFRPGWTR